MNEDKENLPAVIEHLPQLPDSWSGAAERGLAARREREKIVKQVLKRGADFGTIPGCGNKPTLLKPGAEKIADSLDLWPDYEELDPPKGFTPEPGSVFNRYRCILRQRGSNTAVASGIGACYSRESKYAKRRDGTERPVAEVLNTVDKMAQKRALVAASLNLGFSEHFTQDIEDTRDAGDTAPARPAARPPAEPPSNELQHVLMRIGEILQAFPSDQQDDLVRDASGFTNDKGKFFVIDGVADLARSTNKRLKWLQATLGKLEEMGDSQPIGEHDGDDEPQIEFPPAR